MDKEQLKLICRRLEGIAAAKRTAADAGNTAHDPKNGQFTSGPGGTGGEHPASKKARLMRARSDVTSARAKKATGKIPEHHIVAHQDAKAAANAHGEASAAAHGVWKQNRGSAEHQQAAEHHANEQANMEQRAQEHHERSRKDK